MKKTLSILLFFATSSTPSYAQSNFNFSGSADTYWKYDFAERENIGTYFANDHNSLSLGMLALGLHAQTGKASFVGELSFCPRGQYLSTPRGDTKDPSNDFHIQNLYLSYAFSERLSITAGYMGTFVGHEVISPTGNFHYSTSYLFGAGPFQNAGIKFVYKFSDKISAMAGLFNDWNVYQDLNGLSHFGAQLMISPTPSTTATLNLLTGTGADGRADYSSGTLWDLVVNWFATNTFSLGANAADYRQAETGGYRGIALYPQYRLAEHIAIGLRGEYFETEAHTPEEKSSYFGTTLSANLCHGGLTLIPEIRLDNSREMQFLNKEGGFTRNASQMSMALLYSF